MAILLSASLIFPSSSEVSNPDSVMEVDMAHCLVWLLTEPPQLLHLYWVEPSPSLAPSWQVTLIVAVSQPAIFWASVA